MQHQSRRGQSQQRSIAGAVLGNALEWYDFTAFAVMTPIISKTFFPKSADGSDLNGILLTTALFGAGFFMRPLGGVVLGMVGDRHGRKTGMTIGMLLMALSVIMITFAPTYASAGLVAPMIMLVARLIQGFSVGGEFGTSTALLIEMAPPGRSGFYGSWQIAGQLMSSALGAAMGTAISLLFSQEEQMAWAWRIPFAAGLIIVPLTFYLRRSLMESEVFIQARQASEQAGRPENSFAQSLKLPGFNYLIGMGMVGASAVSFYVTFGYTVTYAKTVLKLPLTGSFMVQMIAAIVMLIVVPIAGAAADRFDRKKLLIVSLVAYLVTLYPMYHWLVSSPSLERLVLVQVIAGIFSATFLGVYCPTLAELFPTRIRATSLAIVNNVAVLIFGGFAQFFVTLLIKVTGSPLAPVWYVMIALALGLVAVLFIRPSALAAAGLHRMGDLDRPMKEN